MHIHFVGIGGIGLSALAKFLHKDGYTISGSDIRSSALIESMKDIGIEIQIPHSKEAISNKIDILVYSAVIKSSNPEIIEAKKYKIKALSRKEFLPNILNNKKVYSVCGAHGKSTTTAILTTILNSSALIGAESKELGSNMQYKDDNLLVFEADESDGSFLNSNPNCAIVTNAEPEHMDYYNYDLDRFYDSYLKFLKLAKTRVINAEDDFLSTLDIDAIRLYPSKDIKNIEYILINDEPYSKFTLKDFGEFVVWGFGMHIVIDASLAILAAINEIDIESIRKNIQKYRGIKKRFDILKKSDNFILIDDYAHHPTEVKATITSAKRYIEIKNIKDIVAIWQPHKYSRTIDNLEDFKNSFKGVTKLFIMPVYAAGETHIEIDFENEFSKYNPTIVSDIRRVDSSIELINSENIVIDSINIGLVIGFGAGDITYKLRKNINK